MSPNESKIWDRFFSEKRRMTSLLSPRKINLSRILLPACLLLGVLFSVSALLPSAFASRRGPPTVVEHKDGKWQLRSEYVGGSPIVVVDAENKTQLQLAISDAFPKEEYVRYVQ